MGTSQIDVVDISDDSNDAEDVYESPKQCQTNIKNTNERNPKTDDKMKETNSDGHVSILHYILES